MQGAASTSSPHMTPESLMVLVQHSVALRPPALEQPEPPHSPHPSEQQMSLSCTPMIPPSHVPSVIVATTNGHWEMLESVQEDETGTLKPRNGGRDAGK